MWLLDIIRKMFVKPKKSRAKDSYENAIQYIKTNLILDVTSLLPQVASGLALRFVPLKILRLYQIELLHYPLEVIVAWRYNKRDKRKIFVVVYACQTLCRIGMLLHYLAIMWLWIGSEKFIGYEDGYDPWQFSIEDFRGKGKKNLYFFSVYWVCTVVTTVGYGDYSGQNSLEISFTFFLMFFGFSVFSMLQVAVLQVVRHDTRFSKFSQETEGRITLWLSNLEKSNDSIQLPVDIYEGIKEDLYRSFRYDISLIVHEYDFYLNLSPKLQS